MYIGNRNFEVLEIFNSIDGEVNFGSQGRLCTFLRFAKCNLHCGWCDTREKLVTGGCVMDVEEIIMYLERLLYRNVLSFKKLTITGGEPLLQLNEKVVGCNLLLDWCWVNDVYVSIETNGTVKPERHIIESNLMRKERLAFVVDYKFGVERYYFEEWWLEWLKYDKRSWIKVIVDDRSRLYDKEIMNKIISLVNVSSNVAVSCVVKEGDDLAKVYKELVETMFEVGLGGLVINVQLHKLLRLQ